MVRKGTTVSIRYAEVLNPDGTLYTANLRTARNTDYYTLKGVKMKSGSHIFFFTASDMSNIGLPRYPYRGNGNWNCHSL